MGRGSGQSVRVKVVGQCVDWGGRGVSCGVDFVVGYEEELCEDFPHVSLTLRLLSGRSGGHRRRQQGKAHLST